MIPEKAVFFDQTAVSAAGYGSLVEAMRDFSSGWQLYKKLQRAGVPNAYDVMTRIENAMLAHFRIRGNDLGFEDWDFEERVREAGKKPLPWGFNLEGLREHYRSVECTRRIQEKEEKEKERERRQRKEQLQPTLF